MLSEITVLAASLSRTTQSQLSAQFESVFLSCTQTPKKTFSCCFVMNFRLGPKVNWIVTLSCLFRYLAFGAGAAISALD